MIENSNLTVTAVLDSALLEYSARHSSNLPGNKLLCFSTELIQSGRKRHVGGYADRLKGLLSTALFAILADRTFVVEWAAPYPLMHTLSIGRYDLYQQDRGIGFGVTQWSHIDAIDDMAFTHFRTKLLDSKGLYERLRSHPHPLKLYCNIDFVGDLLKNKEFLRQSRLGRALIRCGQPDSILAEILFPLLFRNMFTYHPTGPARHYWETFLKLRHTSDIVGIQFRTGQGEWTDPQLDDLQNAETIATRAHDECRKRRLLAPSFYVSSDNTNAGEAIAAALGHGTKVLRFGLAPAHFERSESNDIDAKVHFPVMEHMCLAHCDIVVHGRGGFGLTAAKLGGIPAVPYYRQLGER